ncbi:efflux transporter outer membrane subunit (plasmid) [Acidovorax sp. DW039]|uniref:efflux transporter outer membrane subunit n=1 Tax=Acidovorax sp. DW039 TaxID=3095606 RepID=UPI003088A65C|nr:efflux transporter outer membrane subunit [Acidovorax sp. DW039]
MASITGCTNLAPAYQTPQAPVPAEWQGMAASSAPVASHAWSSVVLDDQLRSVIALALEHNRDWQVAALNVAKARATYKIQDAAQWPVLNLSGSHTASRTPSQANASGQTTYTRQNTLQVGITAYEVDFFGRIANLSDAALQSYLGTEQAQQSTRLSLVADVSNAWLTLRADRTQLALARQTLASQTQSLERIAQSHRLGASSALTVTQAQTAADTARLAVATYTAQVQQDLNALELLLGTTLPASLQPEPAVQPPPPAWTLPPASLSSQVLQQRPDVRNAEHQLQAANANIGAARAALFPRISLTAAAGTASTSLDKLFQGGAWSFVPSVSLPLFDGGSSQAQVEVSRLNYQIQLATYEKAIQTAFREVADALAVRSALQERIQAQQALVDGYQRAYDLSKARFEQGQDSYLTVLDAQRSLFSAQQALVSLHLTEQTNRVTLFKVLGGAWPDPAAG